MSTRIRHSTALVACSSIVRISRACSSIDGAGEGVSGVGEGGTFGTAEVVFEDMCFGAVRGEGASWTGGTGVPFAASTRTGAVTEAAGGINKVGEGGDLTGWTCWEVSTSKDLSDIVGTGVTVPRVPSIPGESKVKDEAPASPSAGLPSQAGNDF